MAAQVLGGPTTYEVSRTKMVFEWNNLATAEGWIIIKTLDIVVTGVFLKLTAMMSTFVNVEFKPHFFHALFLIDFGILWYKIWTALDTLTWPFQNCSKNLSWWVLDGEIIIFLYAQLYLGVPDDGQFIRQSNV